MMGDHAVDNRPHRYLCMAVASRVSPELIGANAARGFEDDGFTLRRTPGVRNPFCKSAVDRVVASQREAGVTIVNGRRVRQGHDECRSLYCVVE